MNISIGQYEFEGPYKNTGPLEDSSGVYVILDYRADSKYYIIDVGESAQVKTRVETHDRKDCWNRYQQGDATAQDYLAILPR